MCLQALHQTADCVMGRMKHKSEWVSNQLTCEEVVALQCALQQSNAEVVELRAQLASVKRMKMCCLHSG